MNFCYRTVLSLSLFAGFSLATSNAQATDSHCQQLMRRASFARLQHEATLARQRPSVEAPHWFKLALPPEGSFVNKPGREHAPGLVQKELGPEVVAIQIDDTYNGLPFSTTVGVSSLALFDNLLRRREGRPVSLLPEHARAGALFMHGGGVRSSSYANAANAAQMTKRYIYTVGLDWWAHGSNQPQVYPRRPMDYVEFGPWFMQKYLGDRVPLVIMGHSMGGQTASLVQTHLRPAILRQKFPNLPLKGAIMLSPPVDRTRGADLHTKFMRDPDNNPGAEDPLLDTDNINPASQVPLLDQYFLDSLDDSTLRGDMIPGLVMMGDKDAVCYTGCEDAFANYFMGRPNTDTILLGNNVVDHSGANAVADHFIPKYFLAGQSNRPGVGATMPIVFAQSTQFIERHALGDKTFDVFSPNARNLNGGIQETEATQIDNLMQSRMWTTATQRETATAEIQAFNANRAYRSTFSNVLALFAKNTLFRQFVRTYQFRRRVPISPELTARLNAFLSGLEKFNAEANQYLRYLLLPNHTNETQAQWKIYFDWLGRDFNQPDEALQQQANRVGKSWANNRNPGFRQASQLLSESMAPDFAHTISHSPESHRERLNQIYESANAFPTQWSTFFAWMHRDTAQTNEALRQRARELMQTWGQSTNAGYRYAAGLLSESLGDTTAAEFRISDMPDGFPTRLSDVFEAITTVSPQWKLFKEWFENPTNHEAIKQEARQLVHDWHKSPNLDQALAARAMAMTMDEEFATVARAPLPKQVKPGHPIIHNTQTPTAQSIAQWLIPKAGLSEILENLNRQRQIILGLRDVNLENLALLYPQIAAFHQEKETLIAEHQQLVASRSNNMITQLVQLHSQRTQMARLFQKDTVASLLQKGAELETQSQRLPSPEELRNAQTYTAARALFDKLEDSMWRSPASHGSETRELIDSNLRKQAFESFMGPALRNAFSALNDLATKGIPQARNPKLLSKAEGEFLVLWHTMTERLIEFTDDIRGASAFANLEHPDLVSEQAKVAAIRNDVATILKEMFVIRRDFIRDHHQDWSADSRPAYPDRLYELIRAYDLRQADFQLARQAYSAKQRELAMSGSLGPYLKLMYQRFDELENEIVRLNGSEDDIGTRTSLTTIEDRLIQVEDRMAAIDAEVIERYVGMLYRNETIDAWSVLDNPQSMPNTDQLSQLLGAWYRIWRDPTGGQVQESTGYQ